MKVIKQLILEDVRNNRPISVNLGSGGSIRKGYYGVDILPLHGEDVQADLNYPLEFTPDNSVISVTSEHLFEHISNLFGLLKEPRGLNNR